MVAFTPHTTLGYGYAFRVGACVYSHRQHHVRADGRRFTLETALVLVIGTDVSRCGGHAPQRHVEEFVRQSKARMGRSLDGTGGLQFPQRTYHDGNDHLRFPGYLARVNKRLQAVAISYSDHNDLARFPGCVEPDVSGCALL